MSFCKAALDLRFKSAPTIFLSEICIFEIRCFCLMVLSLVHFINRDFQNHGRKFFSGIWAYAKHNEDSLSLSRDIAYL